MAIPLFKLRLTSEQYSEFIKGFLKAFLRSKICIDLPGGSLYNRL